MNRPPPTLVTILLLIAATKLVDQALIRAILLGALFVVGCLVVGHSLSRGLWTRWQTGIAAMSALIVIAWVSGRPLLGSVLVAVAVVLLIGQEEGGSLLHRASVRFAVHLPIDRIRDWAFPPACAPIGEAVPTTPTRAAIARDLALVFIVALGLRGVWAVVIPPWQAPDEQVHYSYTEHIVEQGEIPHPNATDDPNPSIEVLRSWDLTLLRRISGHGASPTYELPYLPIHYDYSAARTYQASAQERHVVGPLTDYPPLYYLYSGLPYVLLRHAPILSRLFAIRYGSAVLGALTCLFAYLLAYEVRRERRWGLALGLAMALMPMFVFVTSVANNDAALDLLATALIWLIVRAYQRPTLSRPLAIAIGATSGLALLTKALGFPLVVVAGVIVLARVLPTPRPAWRAVRNKLFTLGLYATTTTVMYVPWIFFRYHYIRQVRLLSIPLLPLIRVLSGSAAVSASALALPGSAPLPLLATAKVSLWSYLVIEKDRGWDYFQWLLVKTFWGDFGWLDAPLADRVYLPIMAFCAIGGIGLAVQMFMQSARRRVWLLLVSLLLIQVLFLFIGVDYYEGYVVKGGAAFGLQGRYFFPVLAPLLFAVFSGWDHLWRGHPLGLRLAMAGMIALQGVGLATVIARYYGVVIG